MSLPVNNDIPVDIRSITADSAMAARTPTGSTVDLNSSGDKTDPIWLVSGNNRMSVQSLLDSGAWGSAVVTLEGSVDGNNYNVITTLTADKEISRNINIAGYAFVRARVTSAAGTAGTASIWPYSYVSPVDEAAVGTAWTSWTPTYSASGSMTWTSVTTEYAKYFKSGKTVHYAIGADGTTGGVVDYELRFTAPLTIATNTSPRGVGMGYIEKGSAVIGAYAKIVSATVIGVWHHTGVSYGTTTGRRIRMFGTYETDE